MTGAPVWGPSAPQAGWDMYGMGGTIAEGHLFSQGYGGKLYAYNLQTGKIDWVFNDDTAGTVQDSPYGQYPLSMGAVAHNNGNPVVYLYSSEHSPTKPQWRGSSLRCINATDGSQLFKIDLWSEGGIAVADGVVVALNAYDAQIYAFSKGLSATTVTAPQVATPQGTPVLVQGTVTDQSPGQTCLGIPAKGTPAISDNSMSAWMLYLYEQQAKPTNATGVTVHLTASDPNGNTEDLGYTTSDITGSCAIKFTPPVPGMYTITASFDGTSSYYSSQAETHLLVTPAVSTASPAPAVTPTPTQPAVATPTPVQQTTAPTIAPTPSPVTVPPASSTPTMTYVAVGAVVIIIIAIAAALALRRRK